MKRFGYKILTRLAEIHSVVVDEGNFSPAVLGSRVKVYPLYPIGYI